MAREYEKDKIKREEREAREREKERAREEKEAEKKRKGQERCNHRWVVETWTTEEYQGPAEGMDYPDTVHHERTFCEKCGATK